MSSESSGRAKSNRSRHLLLFLQKRALIARQHLEIPHFGRNDRMVGTVHRTAMAIGVNRRYLLSRQPPEQKHPEDNEEDVRYPDQKFGMEFGISAKCIGKDDEQKVSEPDNQ